MLSAEKRKYLFPVAIACLSLFALGWMDNARGPFFPLFLEKTGISSSQGALFFALTSFVSILSAASAGSFLKRAGLKSLLYSGGGAMALSPFGLVLQADFYGAMLTAFLFGVGLGWTAVGQNILISKIEEKKLRRRLFSLLHCFYALAAMSAPLTVVWIYKWVSWNHIFLALSILCLPFLLGVFLWREQKSEAHAQTAVQTQGPLFKNFWIWVWLAFLSFYISSELILSTRLVVAAESYGFSFAQASNHLFYFFLAMFVARFSFFIFKFHFSSLRVLFSCLLGILVSFILGHQLNTYFFSLIGLFMGPIFPVVIDEIAEQWPQQFDLLISRVISVSSLFVVSAHIFVGYLTDIFSIQRSFWSVFVLAFLAFLVLTLSALKKRFYT